jgi:hypothetical protein
MIYEVLKEGRNEKGNKKVAGIPKRQAQRGRPTTQI